MTASVESIQYAQVSDCIAHLQKRAKADRRGVSWTIGANFRQANASLFENSIGFGTPGIILFLLEYYRQTGDRDIIDLIEKGTSWLLSRLKNNAFQDGFYGGTSGVWFLLRELEKTFPALLPRWREDALFALNSHSPDNQASNLTNGIAGTILGIQACLDLDPTTERRIVEPLLKRLTANALPTSHGIHWDFSRTSIKAPIGFLQGNSGINYVLAESSRRYDLDFTPLLTASLAYTDSLFDHRVGNWLDQDGPNRLSALKPELLNKLLSEGKTQSLCDQAKAEDNVSWGTGTLGILLSCLRVNEVYREGPLAANTTLSCQRAIARLQKLRREDWSALGSSAVNGLAGFALTVPNLQGVINERFASDIANLKRQAADYIPNLKVAIEDEDLSIMTGVCASAYAELRFTEDFAGANILDPLIYSSGTGARKNPVDLSAFLENRFPNSSQIPEFTTSFATGPIELQAFQQWASRFQTRHQKNYVATAVQHEIGVYELLSQTEFQACCWRELSKQCVYGARYNEGMEDNVLFETFRIDNSVNILELDCDPYSRPLQPSSAPVYILRQSTSTGVVEAKLSPLQHALLDSFAVGAVAIEAIKKTIKRVETPNVTQRQLASHSLKLIRGYIQSGQLVTDSTNSLQAWINRKRLKNIKQLLFPAGRS